MLVLRGRRSDLIVLHTPGPEEDQDTYTRMAGLSAADLLKWRWLCATGVYHASGNTLSPEVCVCVCAARPATLRQHAVSNDQ